MRFLSLVIFLLFAFPAWSQVKVAAKVVDTTTGEPVGDCVVEWLNQLDFAETGADGRFEFKNRAATTDTIVLRLGHVAYESLYIKTTAAKWGLEYQLIGLKPLTQVVSGITISAKPTVVYGSKDWHVADFAFVGSNLLLLTYDKEERFKRQEDQKKTLYSGCHLVLIDSTGKEITDALAPSPALRFYLNYYNEIFLECLHDVHYVKVDGDRIYLESFPMKDFKAFIEPVIDTVGDRIFYSNYKADYPAFEYLAFNRSDSTYETVRYLVDEELMQRFRAQYRDLSPRDKLEAFRMGKEYGVDKEVVGAYMTGFPSTPYYQPLNIPLIMRKDTLLIFDHVHDKLYRYSSDATPLDSVLIRYHRAQRPDKWKGKLTMDQQTGKVYTWYEHAGTTYMKEIDTHTGASKYVCRLTYPYVEGIKVRGDRIYYIYRPFESAQRRFLYSERIPFTE